MRLNPFSIQVNENRKYACNTINIRNCLNPFSIQVNENIIISFNIPHAVPEGLNPFSIQVNENREVLSTEVKRF